MKKLDIKKVQSLIDMAADEDFGQGDPTSEITIKSSATAKANLITREEIVVCGSGKS